MIMMIKHSQPEDQKKRERIQRHFWDEVGSLEHISLPELENAVKKVFERKDDRHIQAQIGLMQTEHRVRIESKAKVWIKQPQINSS
jgi:hypothetical protein